MTRVVIVHYTPPAVIGGVESVIGEHARLLRDRGYDVTLVAGRPSDDGDVVVIPEIDAAHPMNKDLERALMVGEVPGEFGGLRDTIARALAPVIDDADVLIVHNAFTLHFSLPLTAVLFDVAGRRVPGSTIAWCHDLSWTNPLYVPGMFDENPWNLLRRPAPGVTYVTVSELRRQELAALWGGDDDRIEVVPNGVDAASFLRLSPQTVGIADRYDLWKRDIVMLLPVRATRRKNIEAAIGAVKELRDREVDAVFLITGPTQAHHPERAVSYRAVLMGMAEDLGVAERVVFLSHDLGRTLGATIVSELYSLADVVVFPSTQEGFGVPVLEAGLACVPLVLSDIPIFYEVSDGLATFFPLDASAPAIADRIVASVAGPQSRLFKRVMSNYRWDAIADKRLVPLVEAARLGVVRA